MPKLVVMLRVKDGIFFAGEWLRCYEFLADEIVVLDNGSTDGTYELLKSHPRVATIIRTWDYNEGRDKNLLYEEVRKRRPDWCLWVDIDELFEPHVSRSHLDKLMKKRFTNKYGFRRFHFIDRHFFAGSWFRLNYSAGHDRIMWRESGEGYFENTIIDSPNIKGIKGVVMPTHIRIKHIGYINKELVDKKADLYRRFIPEKENTLQEMYLRGEKKIRWIDNPVHIKVIGLNLLLDIIRVSHLYYKVRDKFKGLFQNWRKRKMVQTSPGT